MIKERYFSQTGNPYTPYRSYSVESLLCEQRLIDILIEV